jgi:DNA-binding transcriptional ArsR family regulator
MASETNASEEVRVRSKQLFGNSYMLEVCAALDAVKDRTNLTELLHSSNTSPSLYSAPLHRLLEAGLITREPRSGDGYRERWYRPGKTGLWRVARELVK